MNMNVDKVMKELECLSIEDMTLKYTKSQLKDFYKVLFGGLEPRSSSSKTDLAYACWNFIANDKRTKDLCKNLR